MPSTTNLRYLLALQQAAQLADKQDLMSEVWQTRATWNVDFPDGSQCHACSTIKFSSGKSVAA